MAIVAGLPNTKQLLDVPDGNGRLEKVEIDLRDYTSRKIRDEFSPAIILEILKQSAFAYYEWVVAYCESLMGDFNPYAELIHKEDLAIGAQPAGPLNWLLNVAAAPAGPTAVSNFEAANGIIPTNSRFFMVGFGVDFDPNNDDDNETLQENGRGDIRIDNQPVYEYYHRSHPGGGGNPAANNNGMALQGNQQSFLDPDGLSLALVVPVNRQWTFNHGFDPATLTRATYIRYILRGLYVKGAKAVTGSAT